MIVFIQHFEDCKELYLGVLAIIGVIVQVVLHLKKVDAEREARNSKGIGGFLKYINSKYGRGD